MNRLISLINKYLYNSYISVDGLYEVGKSLGQSEDEVDDLINKVFENITKRECFI